MAAVGSALAKRRPGQVGGKFQGERHTSALRNIRSDSAMPNQGEEAPKLVRGRRDDGGKEQEEEERCSEIVRAESAEFAEHKQSYLSVPERPAGRNHLTPAGKNVSSWRRVRPW